MRPGGQDQALFDLGQRQSRVHRPHQRRHRRHRRRGKAGARCADIARRARAGVAQVAGRDDAAVTQIGGAAFTRAATRAAPGAVAARRGQRHGRPEVGVPRLEALAVHRRHRKRARATGRPAHAALLVAGRHKHQRAGGPHLGQRRFIQPGGVGNGRRGAVAVAGVHAAVAQHDQPRRVGVGGYAGHRQARRPAQAVDDVAHRRTAFARHPHRQHQALPVGRRAALVVVADGRQLAGDGGAVPA